MKAQYYEDIDKFYDLVFPFLLKKEIENGLIFSILNSLKQNIYRNRQVKPIMLTVTQHNEIKLMALRTPPHDLLLSYTYDLASIEILIESLLKRNEKLPGVLSFKEAADKFTKLWCENYNLEYQLLRKERIFKLEKVSEETLGKKQFSAASKQYESIVLNWAREMI